MVEKEIQKYRVLIVDDEAAARHKLVHFLNAHDDFEVVGEASNGVEALEKIEKLMPRLVFLDIEMPLLDGISVASNLEENKDISIVFITGYNHFAVKAFELNAVDYLLKPYDKGRLLKTLTRFKEFLEHAQSYNIPKIIQDYRAQSEYPEKLLFKAEGTIEVVNAEEILWLESSGNYVKVCLDRTAFIARQALITVLSQLDPRLFVRIHRTHIVKVSEVISAEHISKGDYNLTLRSGAVLRLSRNYRKEFFNLFDA